MVYKNYWPTFWGSWPNKISPVSIWGILLNKISPVYVNKSRVQNKPLHDYNSFLGGGVGTLKIVIFQMISNIRLKIHCVLWQL
jgi:hypothetical protein